MPESQRLSNLETQVAILDKQMTRLVGNDDNGGIIGKLNEHLSKVEKYLTVIFILISIGVAALLKSTGIFSILSFLK